MNGCAKLTFQAEIHSNCRVSIAEIHVVFELSNKKDIYIIVQISSAFLLRATSLECDEFDEFI